MLVLVNCIRYNEKKTVSLVTMVVALFFAEHRSAINLPLTISSTLLSLNSLTLDYIGLLVSFSVSSIHITCMLNVNVIYEQRRSSRPPNSPIGGAQASFGGPSWSEIAFWLRDYLQFSRLVYNRFKL